MKRRRAKTVARNSRASNLLPWWEAVPHDRLAHIVKGAWRSMVRSLQLRLADHGVSFGHWTFLRILWSGDGLTQRELSDQAGVMEPTTFSALNAMERLGYITRRRLPDSRKKIYVFLTPRGRQLQTKLVPLAEEVNRLAVLGAKKSDVAATRRTLLSIIHNLAAEEAASARSRTVSGSPGRRRTRG